MVNVNKLFPQLSIRVKLAMAETQTSREMLSAEQHVDLITKIVQGPLLADQLIAGRTLAEAEWVISSLLQTEPSLYQVKLVDASGQYRLVVRASGKAGEPLPAEGGE